MEQNKKSSIASIRLTKKDTPTVAHLIQRDCDIALRDLKQDSYFQPTDDDNGPYALELYIEENRLIFHTQNNDQQDLPYLVLSLTPYRRLIKDYFMIVSSYDDALRDGKPSRIEAIDMGRRGLHNEGAELLMERLTGKIELNINTARRLFTLICVLHSGKAHILR
ncbi:MAG: hypothetical protein COB14_08025 [Alphaproteobacteria bacterium]|nr:MAG: hypothetical protein COB14_08025 [Alphaproteobacteria bacterium]